MLSFSLLIRGGASEETCSEWGQLCEKWELNSVFRHFFLAQERWIIENIYLIEMRNEEV